MKALGFFGDFYHQAGPQRELFQKAGSLDWTWASVVGFDWSTLAEYQVMVLAVENRVDPEHSTEGWMTDGHTQGLDAWVRAGGSLVVFHSGLASYPEDGAHAALVGGSFQFHPRPHPKYRFVPGATGHRLTTGVDPFEVTDELYFVRRDPKGSTLLATAESPEYGSSAAFWCAHRGRGRIVGLTPGHNRETLAHPGLVKLVGNVLAWCVEPGTA